MDTGYEPAFHDFSPTVNLVLSHVLMSLFAGIKYNRKFHIVVTERQHGLMATSDKVFYHSML